MFFGIVGIAKTFSTRIISGLPIFILLASLFGFSGEVNFGLPQNYGERKEMTKLYSLAQKADFQSSTIFLFGATFLPTDTKNWEKSMGSRLFQKKNSNLFVAERLSISELDSLYTSGFQIFGIVEENAGLFPACKKVKWIRKAELSALFNRGLK